MKKLLSLLLASAIAFAAALYAMPHAVASHAEPSAEGDFGFTLAPDGTAVLTDYLGAGGDVAVPASLSGHAVTEIGENAFYGNYTLTSVALPEGVLAIGRQAFAQCGQMTAILLPKSLQRIDKNALYNCERLQALTLPSGLEQIGEGAFAYCKSLRSFSQDGAGGAFVVQDGVLFRRVDGFLFAFPSGYPGGEYAVPSGTPGIAPNAFGGVVGPLKLILNPDAQSIGEYALAQTEGITEVVIPDSVTRIDNYAFYSNKTIAGIHIPLGVTQMGKYVFGACSALKAFQVDERNPAFTAQSGLLLDKAGTTLLYCPGGLAQEAFSFPEGITAIGEGAFDGCALTQLIIPDGVHSLGAFAACACPALEEVFIPESVTFIGNCAFRYDRALVRARLPAGLTTIIYEMFHECSALAEIDLPATVQTIEGRAFSGCKSLGAITLPEGLSFIGWQAFFGCKALTSLRVPASVAQIEAEAFAGCPSLTLTVTEGSAAHTYALENALPFEMEGKN